MRVRHAPLFKADWLEPVFMHFRIDRAELLQPHVPFELDTFDGAAYVSLVAFSQARLRPTIGGPIMQRLAKLFGAPLASHEFLNLRTYVRGPDDRRGIYFIAEWIPNRLAVMIGPPTYGLPYRLGKLAYRCDAALGLVSGSVGSSGAQLVYSARFDPSARFAPAVAGTLDHFLLERYTAFTSSRGVHRRFDVAHEPWPMIRVADVELPDTSLLRPFAPRMGDVTVACGHFSQGVTDVRIGAPVPLLTHRPGRPLYSGAMIV
jgi:uncharacterized protein YqjF (DUF2071 family)